MLSQHEADTLAEALTVLGTLRDAARGEQADETTTRYRSFGLGAFSGSCHLAQRAIQAALSDASAYLDDAKARDVLDAG